MPIISPENFPQIELGNGRCVTPNQIRAAIKIRFGATCTNPDFQEYADEIIAQIDELAPRHRLRTNAVTAKLKQAVTDIILALHKAEKNYFGVVGINLNKNHYSQSSKRYNAYRPSYRLVKFVYDCLPELRLIEVVRRGNHTDNTSINHFSTRIAGTGLLHRELQSLNIAPSEIRYKEEPETIILRESTRMNGRKVKNECDYRDTRKIKTMRRNLAIINGMIARNHIDIELTDSGFQQLQRDMCCEDRSYEVVDLDSKHLRRVFTNDFKHGGRFYGGFWQQIPKTYRKHIKINGNATVEIDYRRLHPHLLYSLANVPMPVDPYDVGIPNTEIAVKHIFNAMLNARDKRIKKLATYSSEDWKNIKQRVIEFHAPVQGYFCRGYGLRLQYLDSRIAEHILLALTREEILALVVHDSFIVELRHQERLRQVMAEAVQAVAHMDIPVAEIIGTDNRQAMSEIINSMQILREGGEHAYSEYNVRFTNWLQSSSSCGSITIH